MGDQSWKGLPSVMSNDLIKGIVDFVQRNYDSSDNISINFHGGEPLMYGPEPIKNFIKTVNAVDNMPHISYSVQTNMFGSKCIEWITELDDLGVTISASTDGYEEAMDLHRLTKSGASSFNSVNENLLVSSDLEILHGLISVIDPQSNPRKLIEYLSQFDVSIDFLPIDTNWSVIDSKLIIETSAWFSNAFIEWGTNFQALKIWYFYYISARSLGYEISSDAFGPGEYNLISIEPDGSIHGLDVLKSNGEGLSNTGLSVYEHNLQDILESDHFVEHTELSKKGNLPTECRNCNHQIECHGGSVPHRWDGENYSRKSAHCATLHSLFSIAKAAIIEENDINFSQLLDSVFRNHSISELIAIDSERVYSKKQEKWKLDNDWKSLDKSMELLGGELVFHDLSESDRRSLSNALLLINKWNPVFTSFITIFGIKIFAVQPIEGPTDNLISYTDSLAPYCIFINIRGEGNQPLDIECIAENIVHECTHLILDIALRGENLSKSSECDLVVPWRNDKRHVHGVFHGALVWWVIDSLHEFCFEDYENGMKSWVQLGLDQLKDKYDRFTKPGRDLFNLLGDFEYALF